MTNSTQYKILVENRALEGWKALEEEHPGEMDELKRFLKQYPTNLGVTAGKAKRLRGKLKEYRQYDVTYSERIRYQVDKRTRRVTVAYAGPHP